MYIYTCIYIYIYIYILTQTPNHPPGVRTALYIHRSWRKTLIIHQGCIPHGGERRGGEPEDLLPQIYLIYGPYIRARLGTAAHVCEVVVLKLRTVPRGAYRTAVNAAAGSQKILSTFAIYIYIWVYIYIYIYIYIYMYMYINLYIYIYV